MMMMIIMISDYVMFYIHVYITSMWNMIVIVVTSLTWLKKRATNNIAVHRGLIICYVLRL